MNVKFLNRLVTLNEKFQPFGIFKLENVNVINHFFNPAKLLLEQKIKGSELRKARQNYTLVLRRGHFKGRQF